MAESVATSNEVTTEAPATERWWNRPMPERPFWKDALHIFAIFNFAVAYPVLDYLGEDAWFYVVERAKPIDMFLLAGTLCIGIPLLFAALLATASLLSGKFQNLLQSAFLSSFLIAGTFYSLARRFAPPEFYIFSFLAILASLFLVTVYMKSRTAQLFATMLIISAVVVPSNFLFFSEAADVAIPQETASVLSDSSQVIDSSDPIVMIVTDELPLISLLDEKHLIDGSLYPHLRELSEDSYWFRNATTISDSTQLAVPAIITGTRGDPSKLPSYESYPDNLFSWFTHSHSLNVIETVTYVCSDDHCANSRLSLSERLDLLRRGTLGNNVRTAVSSNERNDLFGEFTKSINSDTIASLSFHHSMLPHAPWWYLPSGKQYSFDESQPRVAWEDEWILAHNQQRHLLQVQHLDSLVGNLIRRLKDQEMYDESLIVFVADHGASFSADYQYRELNQDTASDILYVPLIIKLPGQHEGVISDRNVQVIDILPTIADVLDVQIPWEVDGQSAIDETLPEPEQKRAMVSNTGEWMDFGRTIDGLEESLQRKLDLFGDGTSPDRLYTMGRYSAIVGETLSSIPISGDSGFTFSLDDLSKFDGVDTEGGFIPALIEGTLETQGEPERQDIHLAIAVNGTIQAVSGTYQEAGETRFAALVPEDAFINGDNQIDLLALTGNEESPMVTHATIN